MPDRELEYSQKPTELLGLPTPEWIAQCATACRGSALPQVARMLTGMHELLLDKKYISTRADYNRGHLSYCGQIEAREWKAFGVE